MKKLLVIAVALAAVNAQATTARVTALGNSAHLIDTQTVYSNPADIFSLGGDYVTLETGANGPGNATQGLGATAEGMIVRTMGDAKLGLALGNRSTTLRSLAAAQAALPTPAGLQVGQQNPVEFTYGAKAGDLNWAGTLVYSNFNDKTAAEVKESTLGVRFGVRAAGWDAALRLGLGDTVQTAAAGKYTGTMSVSANGGYWMDSVYLFGNLATAGYKWENAASVEQAKYTRTAISVGALSTVKKDGTEVFYSAALTSTEAKNDDSTGGLAGSKTSTMTLPLQIGVEAEANSWLTLRGSITQNLQLMNNSKTSPQNGGAATTDLAPGNDNVTLAAGAGLKFNKVTVDGTLQGVNNGQLNGNNLLTTLGMTYMF